MRFFPTKNNIGLIAVVLMTLAGIFLIFGEIAIRPGKYLLASDGDGLKSYYISEYHIRYDSSYWHSGAMNYPWGESMFYTDGQPLLTNSVKVLDKIIPGTACHNTAIIHIILFAGILLASVFLYYILIMLGIPIIYSVCWAIGISFLSPQIERFQGHLSLAYLFVIPMTIFLLFRADKKDTAINSILFATIVVWSGFTHVYLTAFILLLLLSYILYRAFNVSSGRIRSMIKGLPVWAISAFIFVLQFQKIYDPFTNRTTYPYGFLYYKAFPESVFLPLRNSYASFLRYISDFNYITWEGYAYTGIIAFLATLFIFTRGVRNIFRLKLKNLLNLVNQPLLNIMLWAAIISLVFSFALPFRFLPAWTVDLLGPLKQFRGSGRFSWPFFYIINIVAIYLIWQWRIKNTSLRLIPVFATIILLAEAFYMVNTQRMLLKSQRTLNFIDKSYIDQDQIRQIKSLNFQAILYLPFYHIGSENIWMTPVKGELESSFRLSLECGLPLINVMLGRTSLHQTWASTALVLEPAEEPSIIEHLDPLRPILLVSKDGVVLRPGEEELVKRSSHLTGANQHLTGASLHLLGVDSLRRFDHIYYNGVAKMVDVAQKSLVMESKFPLLSKDSSISLSLSLSPYCEDVVSRTNLIISYINNDNTETTIFNQPVFNYYSNPSSKNIILKVPVTLKPGCKGYKVWLHNPEKRKMILNIRS